MAHAGLNRARARCHMRRGQAQQGADGEVKAGGEGSVPLRNNAAQKVTSAHPERRTTHHNICLWPTQQEGGRDLQTDFQYRFDTRKGRESFRRLAWYNHNAAAPASSHANARHRWRRAHAAELRRSPSVLRQCATQQSRRPLASTAVDGGGAAGKATYEAEDYTGPRRRTQKRPLTKPQSRSHTKLEEMPQRTPHMTPQRREFTYNLSYEATAEVTEGPLRRGLLYGSGRGRPPCSGCRGTCCHEMITPNPSQSGWRAFGKSKVVEIFKCH